MTKRGPQPPVKEQPNEAVRRDPALAFESSKRGLALIEQTGSAFGAWGQAVNASPSVPSTTRGAPHTRHWPAGVDCLPQRKHRCHARLAQGLGFRTGHELPRAADPNAAVGLERQQVLVTCDDDVGLRRQRRGQDEVVIGIATDASG